MENLTIIVPFFNEERFLKDSINRLLKTDPDLNIILINDKSTDSSKNIAIEIVNQNKNIIYLETEQQKGKGNAISEASKEVNTKYVGIHDADLEYFPEDLKEMYTKIIENNNTLILGSRFIGEKQRENIYQRTLIANKVMSFFFSVVNNYKISDIATCYKMMPSDFLKNISIVEEGFSIEVEIVAKFLKYNRSVIEIPILYSGRSYQEGKKIKTKDGFEFLLKTIKYKFFS